MEGPVRVGLVVVRGRPTGEVANRRKVRRSRAGVLSVCGKGALSARQVWAKKASESDLVEDVSKEIQMTSKPRLTRCLGPSG
jgi:hypothetical protein